MVTSPTGKGVIAMGGMIESGGTSNAMFELSQSMQWTRLDQTLQIQNQASLAIPIPDELVSWSIFGLDWFNLPFWNSQSVYFESINTKKHNHKY